MIVVVASSELDQSEQKSDNECAALLQDLAALVLQVFKLLQLPPQPAQDSHIDHYQHRAADHLRQLIAVDHFSPE